MITKDILKTIPELPIEENPIKVIMDKLDQCDSSSISWNSYIFSINGSISNLISRINYIYWLMDLTVKQENHKTKDLDEFRIEININLAKVCKLTLKVLNKLNIKTDDLKNYYEALLKEHNIYDGYYFEDDTLKTGMGYGRYCNIREGVYNNHLINLRPIQTWKEVEDSFLKGGRICNEDYNAELHKQSFDFIKNLWLVLDDDKVKDFEYIQKQSILAWIYLTKLLDLIQHDGDSVGRLLSLFDYLETNNN